MATNDLLDLVLDTLIPESEDGRMPGAGMLGLAHAVREQTAQAKDLIEAGLAAVEAAGFADLDLDGRVNALRELEASHPGFVPFLYMTLCVAYYQHPKVRVGLGLDAGPPYPKGYTLEPGNLDALERVRERGPLWRPS
jgi:hypothetical protein